jgi:hypothetical protein
MAQNQIDCFLAIAVGFAFAGLVSALYRFWRSEPASFNLLLLGGSASVAAVPFLVVAGPAIIMRNTLRGRRYEKRQSHFVAIATALASGWSMAIGFQVMAVLNA